MNTRNTINMDFINDISGIILAGGKSSRMGEDKGLKKFNDIALIEYSIKKIKPQVNNISINTNQNHEQYQQFSYPLITDINPNRLGPLSGIYSSLITINTNWAFFSACDTPYLPDDIVARLYQQAQQQNTLIAVVETNNKLQPLVLLLHKKLSDSINTFLSNGARKTQEWIMQQNPAMIDCSNESNAFININTQEDFLAFEKNQ